MNQHPPVRLPAEAATSIGFENEPAPRRRPRMLLKFRIWRHRWLLKTLLTRMTRLQAQIDEATALVITMARANRHSPWMQGQRHAMRLQHSVLFMRWVVARKELDAMERGL